MTYPISAPPPDVDDTPDHTPLDERPPYGEPSSRWRRILVVALVVALLVLAFLAVRRMVRLALAVWAALRYETPSRPERGTPMVIIPATDSYTGPVYEVRFYDGNYRQLTDTALAVAVDLTSPALRLQLAALASDLQRRVEARDGQRCFTPRLELVDGADRVVGEYP